MGMGDLLAHDTPLADVIRHVVGQAADDVMRALQAVEPEVTVKSVKTDIVTLDAGRNANIAVDDVLDIVDAGQAIGRVRIDAVTDTTASGRLLSGTAITPGKSAKFAGSVVLAESITPAATPDRWATVRQKIDVKDAPGMSFKTVATATPGLKLQYLYSVGTWSKVRNGSTTWWIPAATIEVN